MALQVLFLFITIISSVGKVHRLPAKLFQVQMFEENVEHASFSDSSELAHDELLLFIILNVFQGLVRQKGGAKLRYIKLERGIKEWFHFFDFIH